ncbi:MAG: DUF1801 domain-containing protein [Actinobacteria bacterium]|nr:DUF1801 domain-containing protein [Actinomycetota bacterium]
METVEEYIKKQKSPQKEICAKLRKIIFEIFPQAKEEMKWGVPVFDGLYYIVALKDHVNLGFSIKGLTKEEIALFDGSGKTMRHIKIKSLAGIDKKKIESLFTLIESKIK